jgi:hypothetical protein
VGDCCEHGNEPSGYIKAEDFLSELQLTLQGLCSTELVTHFSSLPCLQHAPTISRSIIYIMVLYLSRNYLYENNANFL